MPALLAAAAAAAVAAADGPSRALPYDAIRDPVITGTAGAAWLLLHVFEERLGGGGRRWCGPPAVDEAGRGAPRPRGSCAPAVPRRGPADRAVPLRSLGGGVFRSGGGAEAARGGAP